MTSKKKKKKRKKTKKGSSLHFVTFPPISSFCNFSAFHFQFSTFPFQSFQFSTIPFQSFQPSLFNLFNFPPSLLQFSFLSSQFSPLFPFFLASFLPVGQQKFLSPAPILPPVTPLLPQMAEPCSAKSKLRLWACDYAEQENAEQHNKRDLFVCLLVCLYVCLFVYLLGCLFVCLFVCLLGCLFVCLFVCMYGLFLCFLVTFPREKYLWLITKMENFLSLKGPFVLLHRTLQLLDTPQRDWSWPSPLVVTE